MLEIIAPEGQMCVNRNMRQAGYVIQTPDDEASGWEFIPEEEGKTLLKEWYPEMLAPSKQSEGESPDQPHP